MGWPFGMSHSIRWKVDQKGSNQQEPSPVQIYTFAVARFSRSSTPKGNRLSSLKIEPTPLAVAPDMGRAWVIAVVRETAMAMKNGILLQLERSDGLRSRWLR